MCGQFLKSSCGTVCVSPPMTRRRLIFCKTPLQAVIARAVQELDPADDVVIYQPTSPSAKHKYYFDEIAASEKLFVKWINVGNSHFFKEIRSYIKIPRRIRMTKFDEYLFASFDSVVLALLAATNPAARMRTFDDGVMSVLPSEIRARLNYDSRSYLWIKAQLGARNMAQLLAAADRHYTIYDPADVVFDRRKTVSLRSPFRSAAKVTGSRLTIMLGTPIAVFEGATTPEMLERYNAIRHILKPDIFIPHPAEKASAFVADHIPGASVLCDDVKLRIAEDLIGQLHARGHQLVVYGIASSALVNVQSFAETYNIIIPGVNEADREVFEKLGVKNVPVAELINRSSAKGHRRPNP